MVLPYRHMPVWANRAGLKTLLEFRRLVTEYFANITYASWMADGGPIENPRTIAIRSEVNQLLGPTITAVARAEVDTVFTVYPAPLTGGYVRQRCVIRHVFDLYQDREVVSEQNTYDVLDQAIGRYSADKTAAWIRTINPFFGLTEHLCL